MTAKVVFWPPHACTHICAHAYPYTPVHRTCTHQHTGTHTHTHAYVCTHTCTQDSSKCISQSLKPVFLGPQRTGHFANCLSLDHAIHSDSQKRKQTQTLLPNIGSVTGRTQLPKDKNKCKMRKANYFLKHQSRFSKQS